MALLNRNKPCDNDTVNYVGTYGLDIFFIQLYPWSQASFFYFGLISYNCVIILVV